MRFKTILALLLLALLLAGCSAGGKDALPDAFLETSYTYPDEWPENRFTDCIPQPDGCTVESVRDLSSVGRYELNLSDITRDETHAYIRRLESEGYRSLGGDENEHSGGVMLQRGTVLLSVSWSGDSLGMLITLADETRTTPHSASLFTQKPYIGRASAKRAGGEERRRRISAIPAPRGEPTLPAPSAAGAVLPAALPSLRRARFRYSSQAPFRSAFSSPRRTNRPESARKICGQRVDIF